MTTRGGFYKYRCKYFYTYNCQSWVWVNNSPCATCLAEGRDHEQSISATLVVARDAALVRVHNAAFQYSWAEMLAPTESGDECMLPGALRSSPPTLALHNGHLCASEFPKIDSRLLKAVTSSLVQTSLTHYTLARKEHELSGSEERFGV
jgi:hypothetical protein